MANDGITHVTATIPAFDVSFDKDAFDRGIRSQGVKLVHWKAMRCPVGLIDLGDNRNPHEHHANCSGGFLFQKAGSVTALFINNSKHKNSQDVGFWDGSTVQVTFPTAYDDSDEALIIAPYDRFYLDEESIVVPNWQLFMHHESGQDKLKFPPVSVDLVVDSRGESYKQDADFTIQGGQIVWGSGRRPAPELQLGPTTRQDRGSVCSVRYYYRPFWYCGQILHEIRVSQIQNTVSGERKLTRMPQSVMLHREYVSQNADNDQEVQSAVSADIIRQVSSSVTGGFGSK